MEMFDQHGYVLEPQQRTSDQELIVRQQTRGPVSSMREQVDLLTGVGQRSGITRSDITGDDNKGSGIWVNDANGMERELTLGEWKATQTGGNTASNTAPSQQAKAQPGTKAALQSVVDSLYAQGSEDHIALSNAVETAKTYAQARKALVKSGPAGLRAAIRAASGREAQMIQMRLGWDAEGNEVAAPMSLQQIADQLGVGKSTVKDTLKRYEITEDVANRVVGAEGATAKVKAATQQVEAPVTVTRADGTTEIVPATQEVPVPLTAKGETTGANSVLNQLLPTQGQDGEVGSLDDAGYSVLDSAGQSKVVEDARTARETAETNKAAAAMGVNPAELAQPSNFQTANEVRGEEIAQANREAAAAAERARVQEEIAREMSLAQLTKEEQVLEALGPQFDGADARFGRSEYIDGMMPDDVQWDDLTVAEQAAYIRAAKTYGDSVNGQLRDGGRGMTAQEFARLDARIKDEAKKRSRDSEVAQLPAETGRGIDSADSGRENGSTQGRVPSGENQAESAAGQPLERWVNTLKAQLGPKQQKAVDALIDRYTSGEIDLDRLRDELDNYAEQIEDGVKYSETQTPEQKLAAEEARWKEVVADYMADRLNERGFVTLFSSTPASMQLLGMPNLPVRGSVSHTLKAIERHGISQTQMESILRGVADPLLVYASKTDGRQWSLSFVTKDTNAEGYVTVAIQPKQDKPGGTTNYVATVVAKSANNINAALRNGGLVYQGAVPAQFKPAIQEGQKKYGRSAIDREALIANGYSQTLPRSGKIAYKSDLVKLINEGKAEYSEVQSATTGNTVEAVTGALRSAFGAPQMFSRKVEIFQSAEDAKAAGALSQDYNGRAQGFVKDGKVFLIADNIQPGQEMAVFLHELGVHVGMENLLGKANMATLTNQVRTWAGKNDGSQESKLAQSAVQRAENSSSENKQAEIVAYFVEEAVNAGVEPKVSANPVARWLANFQRWATSKINEWMGKPQKITARDLVQLAYGAAQMELNSAPAAQQPMEKVGDSWYNDDVHLSDGRQWGFSNGMKLMNYAVNDDNGVAIGRVSIGERDGKPAELYVIELDADQQGNGMGRRVMEALLATSNGELFIQNIVPSAVGFYESLGVQWVTENKENGDAIYSQATAKARDTTRTAGADAQRQVVSGESEGSRSSATSDQAPRFSEAAVTPSQQDAQGKLAKIGGIVDDLLANPKHFFKEHGLGWLTLEQLADRTNNEGVQEYAAVMNKLQRESKDRVHGAAVVYEKWAKLPEDVSVRLSSVMREATRAQFDPDKDTPATADHQSLKAKFDALDKNAQQIYREVRDYYVSNNKARKAIMLEAAKAAPEGAKNVAEVERLFNELKGPYFPLMRLGSHYVVAMSKEAADLKAKIDAGTASDAEQKRFDALRVQDRHYTTSAYQSAREAQRAERALSKKYDTVYRSVAEKRIASQMVLSQPEFKQIDAYLSTTLDSASAAHVRDMLTQLWFDSLPEHHALKAQMKREGIHGEEADMRKVFATSAVRQSHYISRLKYAQDLSAAMQKTKKIGAGDNLDGRYVANELLARNALAMQPSEGNILVDTLRNVSYFAHLGVSPAFWLTNATQVPMITLPWLGARHGAARSTAAIWNAFKDVSGIIKSSYDKGGWHADFDWKGKLSKGESEMLENLRGRNLLDITMEHDLSAAGEITPGKWGQRMNDTVNFINIPVRVTELANRAVTALAAYRLAVQKGDSHDSAMAHAAKAVSTTQLDYSALNAPRHMQSVLGSKQLAQLMMQFRKYQQGMLYLVSTSVMDALKGETPEIRKQARNTLFGLFTTTGLMAGSLGLPFAGTATFLASMLGGLGGDDEPFDAEVAWRNFLTDLFGKDAALVLAKGLPTAVGLDLSKRVGMSDIASPLPFARKGKTGTETVANTMLAAAGAPFGTIADTVDGLDLFQKGQWLKGAEKIVPLKAAANVMRAIRYSTEGLTDRNGELVLGDDKFSVADITLRAMGFQPTKEAEYFAANQAVKQAQTSVMDKRAALIRQYAQAKVQGEDTGDIKAEIDEFNGQHSVKGQRIDMSSLIKATQMRRKMAQERDETGVRLDKRTKPFAERARFAIE